MQLLSMSGVRVDGIVGCLPAGGVDNLAECTALFGDAGKAAGVVKTTGIATRRVAAAGVTALDLCCRAAERLFAECGIPPAEVGAVISVSFTRTSAMPADACRAQARLGLGRATAAFDVSLACSGYPYGLYLAGLLARESGRPVLLLDGDVQTPHLAAGDAATRAVLADAGSATLVSPAPDDRRPWHFAFMTDGGGGDALSMPAGGTLKMDGMAVFRFVAGEVTAFLNGFLASLPARPQALAAHQANVYLVRHLAAHLGFSERETLVSAHRFGNLSSASVPLTVALCAGEAAPDGFDRLMLAGFGGGLSAAAASLPFAGRTAIVDFDR